MYTEKTRRFLGVVPCDYGCRDPISLVLVLFFLAGCQTANPDQSHSESTQLWPLFKASVSRTDLSDGSWRVEEKGDALVIARWDNRKTYDKDGRVISRDEYNRFFPFYETHLTENEYARSSNGSILLLFRYDVGDTD